MKEFLKELVLLLLAVMFFVPASYAVWALIADTIIKVNGG